MENSHKILALDLDGTIVTKGNKISKKNMEAMVKFIDQGNKIVFITGRPFYTSKTVADYFYQKTNRKISYISPLKGAMIYDNINEKVLFESYINNDNFNEIYNISLKNNMVITGYSTQNYNNRQINFYNISKILYPIIKSKSVVKRFGEPTVNDFTNQGFYKINLLRKYLKTNMNDLINEIHEKIPNTLDIAKTHSIMLEITQIGVNKASALKQICELLEVDLKNTIAFGDSRNDLPMLEIAGKSAIISKKKAKKIKFKPDYIPNKSVSKALANLIKNILI